jgi:hypothetical protein
MNVIGHDHRNFQIEINSVVMQAAVEHNLPHGFREMPSLIGTEADEVGLIIALQMWKLSSIKSLRHKE